jgi:hypothetical protein
MPAIYVFVYPTIVHVQHLSPAQVDQQAQAISSSLGHLNMLLSSQVNPMQLEHCNTMFSEKKVDRIDDNFNSYSIGTRFSFRLNTPIINPPRNLDYLTFKFFSGDVSGDIGEALFSYLLINILSLQPSWIGHTRPAKNAGALTPDFVVWDQLFSVVNLLPYTTRVIPLLAEVKAFTGQIDYKRISLGLQQMQTGLANTVFLGLLFLAVRNQLHQGYDGYLIGVEN